jgi:hypothetical protein
LVLYKLGESTMIINQGPIDIPLSLAGQHNGQPISITVVGAFEAVSCSDIEESEYEVDWEN